MGDVIQLLDSFTIERRDRHDGRKHTFELCIIYPDYMEEDNYIVKCKNENDMRELYSLIINAVHEAVGQYESSYRFCK
jgi:hypothetical protein